LSVEVKFKEEINRDRQDAQDKRERVSSLSCGED
jgi:hypothetical protein